MGSSDLPAPPPPDDADLRTWTAWHLARQAEACAVLGSDLYAALLRRAADDVAGGGPAWAVLEPSATRDTGAAVALRLMAAVHRLVLAGRAPRLAPHYPSVGGDARREGAWEAFAGVLADSTDELRRLVALPCQTNEVGRCAALVPGFLAVAAATGRALRLLEIGASAGLNLRWDRYRYEGEEGPAWGEPGSRVVLRGGWDVPAELTATPVTVTERRGCDARPVDPSTPDGRLALTASVWADQPVRFERLRAALDIAAAEPVTVDAARAGDWLPERLAAPADGAATVVFHSVVAQYLPPQEREAVVALLADAGRRATAERPLAWLRMEPERPLRAMAVRLTSWPGGEERLIATAGAHGFPVRWKG